MKALLHRAVDLLSGGAVGPIRPGPEFSGLKGGGLLPVFSLSPSRELMRTLKTKGYTHFRRFFVVPSHSVPKWVLPIADANATLAAAQIYMPYRWGPQAAKKLVSALVRMGWNGSLAPQVLLASKGPLLLETLVSAVTGEHNPVFALSFGRRAAVRKLTVQVMRPQGEILGYMKLPLTEAATKRVQNEATALERLWSFPALRPHIPRLLHAGIWNSGYVLFQSSVIGQLGPTNLTTLHEQFLRTLWSVNPVERSAENLVEEIGQQWDKAVALLGAKWKEFGQEVLRRSAQESKSVMIRCGISHGDFAAWNTRVHEGKLQVFDWESSQWEAPTSWDIFHFGLQTGASLNKSIASSLPVDREAQTAYRLYLLSSVLQFLQEENWTAIDDRQKRLAKDLESTVRIRTDKRTTRTAALVGSYGQSKKPTSALNFQAYSGVKIVTTSWDDGDQRDMKVAELLKSRGIAGTFYIPISGYLNNTSLAESDLRTLSSEGFEIGAHTVSHYSLTLLNHKQIQHEVRTCKEKLQQVLGKEISMFCYPNGRYNSHIIDEVRRAGYIGARTTRMLSIKTAFLPFEMPTSLQAYPHPTAGYLRNLGRAKNLSGIWKFSTELRGFQSWIDLGKRLFNQVLEFGGIWHLYGHSWEIDDLAIWNQLCEMLDHVSGRKDVVYLTNGQLLSLLKA